MMSDLVTIKDEPMTEEERAQIQAGAATDMSKMPKSSSHSAEVLTLPADSMEANEGSTRKEPEEAVPVVTAEVTGGGETTPVVELDRDQNVELDPSEACDAELLAQGICITENVETDSQETVIKEEAAETENEDLDLDTILENSYKPCGIHSLEMSELNIVCVSCQSIICAFCLQEDHVSHHIVSVAKLREFRNCRDAIKIELEQMMSVKEKLAGLRTERVALLDKVQQSTALVVEDVNKAFEQLMNLVTAKHSEVTTVINKYAATKKESIDSELKTLENLEFEAQSLIEKAMAILNNYSVEKIQDATELPARLQQVISQSEHANIVPLSNKDKVLPEVKFHKLLPSLVALQNICSKIHPEATQVVLSLVPKASKMKGSAPKGSPIEITEDEYDRDALSSQVDSDVKTIKTGQVVMCRCQETDKKMRSVKFGRVTDITNLHSNGKFKVLWLKGNLTTGEPLVLSEQRSQRETVVKAPCVLCHFEYRSFKAAMPEKLQKQLCQIAQQQSASVSVSRSSSKSRSRSSTGSSQNESLNSDKLEDSFNGGKTEHSTGDEYYTSLLTGKKINRNLLDKGTVQQDCRNMLAIHKQGAVKSMKASPDIAETEQKTKTESELSLNKRTDISHAALFKSKNVSKFHVVDYSSLPPGENIFVQKTGTSPDSPACRKRSSNVIWSTKANSSPVVAKVPKTDG